MLVLIQVCEIGDFYLARSYMLASVTCAGIGSLIGNVNLVSCGKSFRRRKGFTCIHIYRTKGSRGDAGDEPGSAYVLCWSLRSSATAALDGK